MEYKKKHVLDIVIEDETQRDGREITLFVDTHEMVNIEIGKSVTIRTDEFGVDNLLDALRRALEEIENVRYEKVNALINVSEDEMIQAGIDAQESQKQQRQELSEQQRHDLFDCNYNPNDPVNW